ncbi:MAG: tRNA lysidine(34) synthetase TilS, partial [Acholeplasmatales bacterium]|nr:tRNA lysidine(34) synthetase TilS [Acholeplasmatales bacterium]
MNKLELKVKNYILSKNLIKNNQKVILAFSYGVDSRSLFNVLVNLGINFVVCHVNHKIRSESDLEEAETIKLCNEYNIPCYTKSLTPKHENFEDYARKERYKFFNEVSNKENTNLLVTAHHKDDNLETILFKLMNGSNLYGYAGIHDISYHNNLTIIHPFLCLSKDEIYNYASENNLRYFEDYTNKENEAKRNRIRNIIIPLLKNESHDILDKAFDYSDILSSSFSYIRNEAIKYYKAWNKT